MRSIRRNLLLWLVGGLSLGAIVVLAGTYALTRQQIGTLFDDELRQVALAVADTCISRTAAALAASSLTACSEEPQRLASARTPGFETDGWQDQLRSRTLRQNESNRIYHQEEESIAAR